MVMPATADRDNRKEKTFKDIVLEFKQTLADAGIDTPELDARLLVQGVLEISHEELLLNNNKVLTFGEEGSLRKALGRRLNHEPVSRIMGMRSFWKSEFKVTPETLDPRPDSETLIEAVLEWVPEGLTARQRVLDLGTGTGCLLLSILQEWPKAVGVGLDISAGAARTAAANSRRLNLQRRAGFMVQDWAKFRPKGLCDVVISNPPYIAEKEREDLAPEVLDYDPPEALFGGHDGLVAYRSLAENLPFFLKPNGLAFFEIGPTQAADVTDILVTGGLTVLQTRHDLAGRDRVLVARLTG
jgi:release factor glutamine methyltransferase